MVEFISNQAYLPYEYHHSEMWEIIVVGSSERGSFSEYVAESLEYKAGFV